MNINERKNAKKRKDNNNISTGGGKEYFILLCIYFNSAIKKPPKFPHWECFKVQDLHTWLSMTGCTLQATNFF